MCVRRKIFNIRDLFVSHNFLVILQRRNIDLEYLCIFIYIFLYIMDLHGFEIHIKNISKDEL